MGLCLLAVTTTVTKLGGCRYGLETYSCNFMNTKTNFSHLKGLMLLLVGLLFGFASHAVAQTTEGKDFWVTFLQADQDPNHDLKLSLSISSRYDCEVTLSNPYSGYTRTVTVNANSLELVDLYAGNVMATTARQNMATTGAVCYAVNSEKVDTCALHVVSTQPISLFATNYKEATFDATNVLPTESLKDNYIVQTYTPSDHAGASATQGSHFAIVAAEDNTVVEYCPTEKTAGLRNYEYDYNAWGDNMPDELKEQYAMYLGYEMGDTIVSPVLQKGQVFYVWTGKANGAEGDLSGTYVHARDGKKIAVFQGCPHTNIPYQVKQRDHIFSQAMPTQYWGNTFVLTSSAGRKRDKIRVLALYDGTEVRINGELVHTFDFATDTKQYWEFDMGEAYGSLAAAQVAGPSCVLETSCPCAVHLFMVSQQYDGDKKNNGDPAMLWVNPIEQQIDQITFATYVSEHGTTYHHVNIVTDKPDSMYLDGLNIASAFTAVPATTQDGRQYYAAQYDLGSIAQAHTLKSEGSNFIAHVYGFTENESYGYSAGGATKTLTQAVIINGEVFTPETQNTLCGLDTVVFTCDLNYSYEHLTWHFGDGTPDVLDNDSVAHLYQLGGTYQAYLLVERLSSNLCQGQLAVDSIPFTVNIGRIEITIDSIDSNICATDNQFKVYYSNPSHADLTGENCTVLFDQTALNNGFKNDELTITENTFEMLIPEGADRSVNYSLIITLNTDCGDFADTLTFKLNEEADKYFTQRFNDQFAVLKETNGIEYESFQWYKDGQVMEGETAPVLNLHGQTDYESEYSICITRKDGTEDCSCPMKFVKNDSFGLQGDSTITLSTLYVEAGAWVNVICTAAGTATWLTATGQTYAQYAIPEGGTLVAAPADKGLYLLQVVADKEKKTFKLLIH